MSDEKQNTQMKSAEGAIERSIKKAQDQQEADRKAQAEWSKQLQRDIENPPPSKPRLGWIAKLFGWTK